MTNADKIRSMTDEQLADFLDKAINENREDWSPLGCTYCTYYETYHYPRVCKGCEFEKGITEWLKLDHKEKVEKS